MRAAPLTQTQTLALDRMPGNEDVADELESGGSLVAVSSLSLTASALNPGGEREHINTGIIGGSGLTRPTPV